MLQKFFFDALKKIDVSFKNAVSALGVCLCKTRGRKTVTAKVIKRLGLDQILHNFLVYGGENIEKLFLRNKEKCLVEPETFSLHLIPNTHVCSKIDLTLR